MGLRMICYENPWHCLEYTFQDGEVLLPTYFTGNIEVLRARSSPTLLVRLLADQDFLANSPTPPSLERLFTEIAQIVLCSDRRRIINLQL